MVLVETEKRENIKALDSNHKEIILEDLVFYVDKDTDQEYVSFADILRAEQKRVAKKYNINEFIIFHFEKPGFKAKYLPILRF